MNKTIKSILIAGLVIVACIAALAVALLTLRLSAFILNKPGLVVQKTVSADQFDAELPNPAAAYCEEQGYKLEIRISPDDGQYGVCIFPGGDECDAWAYYRGECHPAAGTEKTIHVDDIGLTFEIPHGWQQENSTWVWVSGEQHIGVAWSDITPGQEPEALFLPQGALVQDRTSGPELNWGTAATYQIQVMAPEGEGQVKSVELHVIIRGATKYYDIYASTPDIEQRAELEQVVQDLLDSATISQ